MESGQLRKLNLCYAGIQSLYWAGFAAIWAFLSVLLLYRGFSNSQIGTVSALALLMPLAVQPVLASLADRDRRFTSRRLAMALTGLLLLCAVGLWCSAGSMAVTAALYVLVGISLTATAPFHSAMAMELQDFVKSTVAPYKYPRAVQFVAQLPRTATGKLQRFRLHES